MSGQVAVIVNTSVKKAGAKWTNSSVPCNPIPDNLYALSVNGLNIEELITNIFGSNDSNASENFNRNECIKVRKEVEMWSDRVLLEPFRAKIKLSVSQWRLLFLKLWAWRCEISGGRCNNDM